MSTPDALGGLLDREQIRELSDRYAAALDRRDFRSWGELFTADATMEFVLGGDAAGREEIVARAEETFRSFGATIHFVCNQVVELDGPDSASGHVYTRAEHEIEGSWVVQAMTYTDRYRRLPEGWRFASRRLRVWYAVDALERPLPAEEAVRWPGRPVRARNLPEEPPS